MMPSGVHQVLDLVPSHPDSTGGLGFLSDAQTKFGWVIPTYGVSYVAPTILYMGRFEQASMYVLANWGYAASLAVGAPLLFTLPLFMFTRQLFHAKSRALAVLQERSMEQARAIEDKWLKACSSRHCEIMSGSDLTGLNALNQVYDHIHKMRVGRSICDRSRSWSARRWDRWCRSCRTSWIYQKPG